MVRAVVALATTDLLSDAGAGGGSSLGAEDDIAFRDDAAAVVLVEVLGAHLAGWVAWRSVWVGLGWV